MTDGLRIAVCVAAGRNPVSGRPCRGEHDARAIELALAHDLTPLVLHHGPAGGEALRDYLGMGIGRIRIVHETVDPARDLAGRIARSGCRVALTGARAQSGLGSGLLPYQLGAALGWPVVAEAVALEPYRGACIVTQALPHGRRRRLRLAYPFVATVGSQAGAPRAYSHRAAIDGAVEAEGPSAPPAEPIALVEDRPVRGRRVRPLGEDAVTRLARAHGEVPDGREVTRLEHPDPAEAAERILAVLRQAGVMR